MGITQNGVEGKSRAGRKVYLGRKHITSKMRFLRKRRPE